MNLANAIMIFLGGIFFGMGWEKRAARKRMQKLAEARPTLSNSPGDDFDELRRPSPYKNEEGLQ